MPTRRPRGTTRSSHGGGFARWVAVLISVLAAALALAEMQEKASQNLYMTHHIRVSDDYAFYQAKTVRQTMYQLQAQELALLPNAADPAVRKQVDSANAEAARLEDDTKGSGGRKQLLEKAKADEEVREQFLHRYELFEMVVGVLQISIVLASVAIVTRVRTLAYVGGIFGLGAIIAGLLVFTSII